MAITTSGVDMNKAQSLSDKNVDAALLRKAWSNDIKYEALLSDPLFNIPAMTGQIDPGKSKEMVPNKIFQDVTPEGDGKYARSITLQLTKALDNDGQEGRDTDNVMGNEENIRLRFFKAFANDWGHGVTGQQFGIDFREMKPTKIYELAKPLLAQWYGEYNGYAARHALAFSVSPNLLKEPAASAIDYGSNVGSGGSAGNAPLNANAYVIGDTGYSLNDSDQTQTVYEEAVNNALLNNSPGHLSVREILDLADWAAGSYIQPVEWNGHQLYMLYVSDKEFTNMLDPATAGSFSKYWVSAADLKPGDLTEVIPGAEFVIGGSIVVCRDRRIPHYGLDAADPTSGQGYFVRPGRKDERKNNSQAKQYAMNFLLGSSALVKFEPEKATYREQKDNYDKYKNVGYFGASSWMTPKWGIDAAENTSSDMQQESSAIVFTSLDFS